MIKVDDTKANVAVSKNLIDQKNVAKIATDLRGKVSATVASFGHKIKPQESYISENLFCFSKSLFFKGIPLQYAFRKIQKTPGESNTVLSANNLKGCWQMADRMNKCE